MQPRPRARASSRAGVDMATEFAAKSGITTTSGTHSCPCRDASVTGLASARDCTSTSMGGPSTPRADSVKRTRWLAGTFKKESSLSARQPWASASRDVALACAAAPPPARSRSPRSTAWRGGSTALAAPPAMAKGDRPMATHCHTGTPGGGPEEALKQGVPVAALQRGRRAVPTAPGLRCSWAAGAGAAPPPYAVPPLPSPRGTTVTCSAMGSPANMPPLLPAPCGTRHTPSASLPLPLATALTTGGAAPHATAAPLRVTAREAMGLTTLTSTMAGSGGGVPAAEKAIA